MAESPENKPTNNTPKDWRGLIWYGLLGLTILSIVFSVMKSPAAPKVLDYTSFLAELDRGTVKQVTIRTNEKVIEGVKRDNSKFKTYYMDSPTLVPDLRAKGVQIQINPADSGWLLSVFLQAFLPVILIGLLWFFILRQAQGANNQAMSFGKSRATANGKDKNNITFKDVAGVDEAVEEVREIVDFLKAPEKYQAIGAKIPKGVLLMGPPGTGKTLLAKAIAGEAGVPFFSLSGSDFVEMFVGVGASRVRDLFKQAKKTQPSIIFVDEIDAVGRHRGAGLGGGHDEREQTLNQLLVEMDGFDPKTTVIVVAATNRPDILDPALLRPGRFDRQVVVDKPDIKGRQQILKIHSTEKKIDENVDMEVIARRTPGFTGADLANLVNEAALLTARKEKQQVTMVELEEATDRVMAGPERKSRLISEKEKEIVAFHEVGHALVAKLISDSDPVHKVSILPRGMALGYTLQLPKEDKYLVSKAEMESQIKVLLGGRIAEQLIFNSITTGASNDIERATDIARAYVCTYGMSEELGTRKYGRTQQQVFLGRDYSDHSKDYSEETARAIDNAIQGLIQRCYKEVEKLLADHKAVLEHVSRQLMEKEVIDGPEFEAMLKEHLKSGVI